MSAPDKLRPVPVAASRPLSVVHLSAECLPYARTGGLGEAVSTLAAHQRRRGHSVAVVMPLHRTILDGGYSVEPLPLDHDAQAISIAGREERVQVLRLAEDAAPVPVFFVEHPAFSTRAGVYGDEGGDYTDNPRRFGLFCKAALAALPKIAPAVQVLHVHDWHTAVALAYLRTAFDDSTFHRQIAGVLSVHNGGYQGHCPPESMSELGLPPTLYDWRLFEWYGRVNLLKGGMAFADVVSTVSPTHAAELRTERGGFGLHDAFATLGSRLVGIVNGIDQRHWDPAADAELPAPYSAANLGGKIRCKMALQETFGLPPCTDVPLIAMCARLVEQKGIDLLLDTQALATARAQFVFLGEGEDRFRRALALRAATAPDRVAVRFAFTDRLEHLLLAGADLCLMPSRYEPCGLTQMRAQRYGSIPVAHRVGGLADTIQEGVTGFLFDDCSPAAIDQAILRALAAYCDRDRWRALIWNAMTRDFGWTRPAARYLDLYERAIATRTKACAKEPQ